MKINLAFIIVTSAIFTSVKVLGQDNILNKNNNPNIKKSPGQHNDVISDLANRFETIVYDSLKIYYFNSEKYVVDDYSLAVDTPNIYNNLIYSSATFYSVRGSRTVDRGKLLTKIDAADFVNILINSGFDKYLYQDPVSEYVPTIGFVFFKNGKTIGHVDVALFDNKLQIELFGCDKLPYRYSRDNIGVSTRAFIKKLAIKYELPKWVFSRRESKWDSH